MLLTTKRDDAVESDNLKGIKPTRLNLLKIVIISNLISQPPKPVNFNHESKRANANHSKHYKHEGRHNVPRNFFRLRWNLKIFNAATKWGF